MNNINEQGKILYATLLPIFALVLILLGAGFFLLRGEYEIPSFTKDVTEIRRLDGFPTIASDVGDLEKQRMILKNQTELNEFLNKVDPSGRIIVKEEIDFDDEFLIAVATDTNETYGYDMKIKKVRMDEEDQKLLVTVVETKPGEFCENDIVPNVALDIVAISKTDLTIDFERVLENEECAEPNL